MLATSLPVFIADGLHDGSDIDVTVEHSTSQDDGGTTLVEVARVRL